MGLSISYPPDDYLPAMEDNMGRLFIRSVSFNDMDGAESPSALLAPVFASPKLVTERSLSFSRRESDRVQTSVRTPKSDKESCNSKPSISAGSSRFGRPGECAPDSPVVGMVSSKHQAAAVRLQKVYKSFRTRRQLADCAVLVEQQWWKLLDFALLKRNSVSFFDIEKPETAVSRWSRARMKAAKVGKGLSKDEKAQKLALQHWLEAIDPRHRYGHNLHFYYHRWLHCESQQPFFYWLDVGDGKDVTLEEHCSRRKLHKQCIKYLGPKEREPYEVIVVDARLMYKVSHQIVDTTRGPKGTKWIFVLSTCKALYIGQKKKGTFQHSSFLAGGATSAAGRLVVENGIMKAVWPHSGHYRPTQQNFQEFVNFLKERSVDLTDVKLSPSEGEGEGEDEGEGDAEFSLKSSNSQVDLTELSQQENQVDEAQVAPCNGTDETEISNGSMPTSAISIELRASTPTIMESSTTNRLQGKRPSRLLINSSNRILPATQDNRRTSPDAKDINEDSAMFGECLDFCKKNLFAEVEEEEEGGELVEVPEELILRRITSKKSMRSCQLGMQLSFQWSTGAGPRIGCVRDYPPGLQFRALEEVSLSPRSNRPMRFSSPRPSMLTPNTARVGDTPTFQGGGIHNLPKSRQRSVTWTAF